MGFMIIFGLLVEGLAYLGINITPFIVQLSILLLPYVE